MIKKEYIVLIYLFLLYLSFLMQQNITHGTFLFFLWLSFWVLCTPFCARQKKLSQLIHSFTQIKTMYWPLISWVLSILYNITILNFYSFLYPKSYFTTVLNLLLNNQSTYWPIMFCVAMKLLYHLIVNIKTKGEHRPLLHHLGSLLTICYGILFYKWLYSDLVILFTVRH